VSTNASAIVLPTFLASIGLAAQGMEYSAPGLSGNMNAQPVVQGEIRNINFDTTDLMIVVSTLADGRPLERVPVEGSGTFQLYNMPPGTYSLKLIRPPGETILEQIAQIGNGQMISLQMPDSPARNAAASTVSADQLQHPLSSKGAKMIRKAQSYAAAGDHAQAIDELRKALNEPSAVPYAHSLLGAEYLKTGQVAPAEAELEQAVQLLPHDPALHSNLAYALFLRGENERSEQEVRKALELDHNNSPAQKLLGYILKQRGGQ